MPHARLRSWLLTLWLLTAPVLAEASPAVLSDTPLRQSAVLLLVLLFGALAHSRWRRWRRRRHARARQQQSLIDELPEALALFDARGHLLAANRKIRLLMRPAATVDATPDRVSSARPELCSANELYARLCPDPAALTHAREQARTLAADNDATLSFEVPGPGNSALLVKEKPTTDGGRSVTVYNPQRSRSGALRDPLTSLATRTQLVSELARRCNQPDEALALVIIDLRGFRRINESYGRDFGDELLRQCGLSLTHSMPDTALIARTAGDEFAALTDLPAGQSDLERRVARFVTRLRNGLPVKSLNVPVQASVGVAYAPEHGHTVSALLTSADSACAHAKRQSQSGPMVFDSDQQRRARRRYQLEVGLQQAIGRGELSVQYQPQIDVRSRMTCGMEALMRWESAEFGKVQPGEFIDVAEQTGIITSLGLWVLRQSIEDYQQLARFAMSPSMLSVNLSRKQFDNGDIVRDVAHTLEMTGFDPSRLTLEITETALFRDSNAILGILRELTALGASLAIDDFGVGYSSLLELRDFPISEVKIDRAFVANVAQCGRSQDIIGAVVAIARSIGAEVVAEGIENQAQFDAVAALGCDRAQGFYLCEPKSVSIIPDVVLGA